MPFAGAHDAAVEALPEDALGEAEQPATNRAVTLIAPTATLAFRQICLLVIEGRPFKCRRAVSLGVGTRPNQCLQGLSARYVVRVRWQAGISMSLHEDIITIIHDVTQSHFNATLCD
ncbi:MAG TPA: hypothetical protein VI365_30560 [Trebonia sp.]